MELSLMFEPEDRALFLEKWNKRTLEEKATILGILARPRVKEYGYVLRKKSKGPVYHVAGFIKSDGKHL